MIAWIFVLCLIRNVFGNPQSKSTDLNFNTGALEIVQPEEIYCFDDNQITIQSIYSASGIIDDEYMKKSMSITVDSKSCQKILKYFIYIILNDQYSNNMMLLNKEFKNEYKNDNSHYMSKYSMNNFECFAVGSNKKQVVSTALVKFTNLEYWTTDEKLVCLIFDIDKPYVQAYINFNNNRYVLIEYHKFSHYMYSQILLFPLCASGIDSKCKNPASNWDIVPKHRTICFNTHEYRFNDLKFNAKNNNPSYGPNCYTYESDTKIINIAFKTKFQYITFKPNSNNYSMIIFEDNIDKNTRNKDSYNIGDIFCRPQSEFVDKSDLIIGYYDKKTKEFCVVVKEIYGTRKVKISGSTITINGCNVDPRQSVFTKKLAILDIETPTLCVHRKYSKTFSTKLTYEDSTRINNDDDIDDYCSIEFPTKRCYYMKENLKYAIIENIYDQNKIYVYHEKYVINKKLRTDYLYRLSYHLNHLICLHKSHILDLNSQLNKNNRLNPHAVDQDNSVCFMANYMLKYPQIYIQNIGGCVAREITITQNDNLNINNSNDEFEYCFPFFKNTVGSISILKLDSDDQIMNCVQTTCTNVLDYISFVKDDGNLLSESYTACRSPFPVNCIMNDHVENSLIIYRTHNLLKNIKLLVTKKDELPMIISDDYHSFYHDTYGKNEIVCFLKNKIQNFNEKDYELKNEKIFCRIVELLKQTEIIEIENFMGCTQVINLNPSLGIPHKDEFQNNDCLFLTNNLENVVHHVNHKKMRRCLELTCNSEEYFVELESKEIDENAKIIDCKRKSKSEKCGDPSKTTIFIMVKNDKVLNGKYMYNSDDSISIKNIKYYSPQYTKIDFICFYEDKIFYDKIEWKNKFLFERKKHVCVFARFTLEDLSLSLNVNKFCNRSIVFRASDDLVEKESWESKCQEFIVPNGSTNEPTIQKFEDIKQCLVKLCITLNYVITKHNENIDCSSHDCYNLSGFKYMKATSQYNNQIFFILPTDVFQSFETNSTKKAFYFNSYYSHDLICIKNDINEDQSSTKPKIGVASLTRDIMCYFVRELSENLIIKTTNSEGCNKDIQLHKTELNYQRIVDARNKEIPCLKFVKEPEESDILNEMSYEQLQECRKSTCFEINFVVQKSNDHDDAIDLATSSVDDKTIDIKDAQNFEYLGILSKFYKKETYIKNTVIPSKEIPEPYFYLPSYYKNESVCINTGILGNTEKFNAKNSYRTDKQICIVTPLMKEKTDIKIIVNQHCDRTVGLYHDKTREESEEQISNENKCKPFIQPTNSVHTLTVDDIKKCLVQTCSKVLRYVDVTNEVKPMISGKITNCVENDYTGSCLDTGKEYDFIEVTNDYVTESLYFRTQEVSERNKGYLTFSYYKPSYGPDQVVCMKKDLIVNINSFKTSSYIYIYIHEDNRVCFLNNKLTKDLNVTYKINKDCNLNILLKNQPINEGSDTEELEPKDCQSFISLNNKLTDILQISRKDLDRCTQITCSTIRQVVVPSSQIASSSSKDLILCDSIQKLGECTKNLDSADAIQIVSPFHKIKFYVSIKDRNNLIVPEFTKHYYYDQYYSDEVLCFAKSAYTPQPTEFDELDMITTEDKLCIVIKDLGKDLSISIKQFSKCDKSIQLKFDAQLDKTVKRSNCLDFLKNPTQFPITTTTEKLKQCIDETCSKIHYLVDDDVDSKVIFEKSLVECKQENGDSRCINSGGKYYFAKVTNPSLSKPLYFRLDKSSGMNPDSTHEFYYKSEYYKEKVVCLQSSMIDENNLSKMIHFVIRPYKCIVNRELINDQLIIQKLGPCNRSIRLKNEPFSTLSSLLKIDEKCKTFLGNPTSIPSINQIDMELLNECVTHTCSVVHGGVDVESITDTWPLGKYTSCESKQEGNTCLDSSKKYDYIKVTNHFVSNPIYFRTEEIKKPTQLPPSPMIFYNSTYSGDDVVCFDKDTLQISSDHDEQSGIFIDSMKTCIVINEFSSDITLKLKIVNECTKDILFSKSSQSLRVINDREFEKKCQAFITQSESPTTTHDLLKNDILTCVHKTCSSISSISELSDKIDMVIPQGCGHPKNVEDCLNNIKDTDTLSITSPFLSSPVKILKSDNEELRYNSSDVPQFYENDYFGDQVLCIRAEHLIEPNEIKTHRATRQIGDKYCMLINKLEDIQSIKLRQFGKCDKTIKFYPKSVSTSADEIQAIDKCQSFYTSQSEPYIQMALADMKECIKSTCSKIKYFISDDYDASRTSPMMQITECTSAEGHEECLSEVSNIHFAKIFNEALGADIIVITETHENVDKLSYDKHFYKQSLSQNDVVCVQIKDLLKSSSYGKKVSFSTKSHKCIVAAELEQGSKISLRTSSDCIRYMKITDSVNAHLELNDDKECALFAKSPEQSKAVHTIDRVLLNKCFLHTCSKIESAVELQSGQPLMQSESILCGVNQNCLNSDKKYDFIKVTNDYLNGAIYLRTFDPTINSEYQPVFPFLYKNGFHKNDVVCFRNDKLPKKNDGNIIHEMFTETKRSCLLLNEVASEMQIKLLIDSECYHNISLHTTVKPSNYNDRSDEMKQMCQIFFIRTSNAENTHLMNKEAILKCVPYTCSKIESFVQLQTVSDSYSSRKLTSCELGPHECLKNTNEFENMKIYSPYLNSTIYVRSSAGKSDTQKVSQTTQYLDSYSKDDVVCIHEDLIIKSTEIQLITPKFRKNNAYCIVAKEVPADTKINIKQYGQCEKTITINPSNEDSSSLDECKEFYSTEPSDILTMDHEKLLRCINKTCSKVDYYVSNKDVSDFRSKSMKECETKLGEISCIQNKEEYQIIKVSNPTRSSFVVKLDSLTNSIPSAEDKSSKLPKYFYKSDYFQSDVVCIRTNDIMNSEKIVLKNSYTTNEETCIIVKELDDKKVIKVRSGKIEQEINLLPKPTSDETKKANSMYQKCQRFIKESKTEVHYMPLNTLKECISFTSSQVESFHEVKENSPNSMIGTIEKCNDDESNDKCMVDSKIYDYIKVQSEFVEKPIYFRTRENNQKSSKSTIQNAHYKKSYYKGNIICFETAKIIEPKDFSTKTGFLVRENKTCVISSDLITTTNLKITITPSCSRTIQISNTDDVKEADDQKEETCRHFVAETPHSSQLPIYNKSLLSECIKSTCSRIVSYVPRNDDESNSILKKVTTCKEVTSDLSCLGTVNEYDALEIYSPITNRTFYVQSSAAHTVEKSFYLNAQYSESYYKDEVICAHQDLVEKGIYENSKVVFITGESHCFIVKETNVGDTLKIKLHGQCDKVLNLISSDLSEGKTQSPLLQQCQDFYTSHKKLVTMNMDLLSRCVEYTCSQINYFLNEFRSTSTDINTVTDCDSTHGKSECISSKNPYIVKVTNPTSPGIPIYVKNEEAKSIDSNTLEKLFYKDQYGKDEFVCFKEAMLTSNYENLPIFSVNSVKCFIGRELSEDNTKISMKMSDGCIKQISIHKSTEAPQESYLDNDKCREFYLSSMNRNAEVSVMDIATLKQCIIRTCSKVETLVQSEKVEDISSIVPLMKCENIHGNADCLINEKNYDFVKIRSFFLSTPLLYRTNEPLKNALTQRKLPLFYSSVYSDETLVCFVNGDVLDKESLTETWIHKEKSRMCVLVSDVTSTTKLTLKVTNDCSRKITFTAKGSTDFQSQKESETICRSFYEPKLPNLVSLTIDQLKTCLTLTCSTLNNQTIRNMLDSCISDTDVLCQSQLKSLRIELVSPYRNDPILVIPPETEKHLSKLGNDPSKYSLIYSKNSIPCIASTPTEPLPENIVKYSNDDDTLNCYAFKSSDSEYVGAINNSESINLDVYRKSDIHKQLESAYESHFHIFTFDSEQKYVSESVRAIVPFDVLNGVPVQKSTDFDRCYLTKGDSNQIVKSNHTTFLKGYETIIPQNLFLSHNLTFYVTKRKACAGYLEDSNIETKLKEYVFPQATYKCLPVFNSYLAMQFNTDNNQLNVTEDLDGKCVTSEELSKLCSHTHEFTKFITLCFSKGMTPEEESKIQSKSESEYQEAIKKSLDIHVYLKDDVCYNRKVTMSQRLGFCEIKNGFLQITLFSYETFLRTVFRKSMIAQSEEYTLLVAIIFIIGLLVSYLLKQVNKVKSNESGMQFHVPLMLHGCDDSSSSPRF